jgi:hypothetical protein
LCTVTAVAQPKAEPAPSGDLTKRGPLVATPSDQALIPLNKKILYHEWPVSQRASAAISPDRSLSRRNAKAAVIKNPDRALKPVDEGREVKPEYETMERLPSTVLTAEAAQNIGHTLSANRPAPSPAYSVRFLPEVSGVDPMVAAGEKFLIVTQDHAIAFYDKSGNTLKEKDGTISYMSATRFFNAFIKPKNPDGTINADNINRYLNFPPDAPIACNLADENPQFPCVTEFYDTRVLYDDFHKRFIILSAARHKLGANDENGDLARRFIAIAVSKTSDPRDGFQQYMATWSNYRDWPWISVNGDYLIAAHKGATDPNGPVASVFYLPAMMAGDPEPPHFKYFSSDVGGAASVIPARHYPGESALTWMVERTKSGTRKIYAFTPPADPWTAPPLLETSVQTTPEIGSIRDSVTYRHGRLQFATVRSLGDFGYTIHMVRIPVSGDASGITASAEPADGFFDNLVNLDADPSLEHRVSREVPSSAVNADGDMLIAYGRFSMAGAPPIIAEVRYAVWYHDEAFPRWSKVLKEGEVQPTADDAPVSFYSSPVDYSAVVVDPKDGKSFWIAHEYGATATKKSGHQLVVGKVTP